jgi:diguanylate cyclase (GGDEF)-like protein/PAS domain S-box-containing protein
MSKERILIVEDEKIISLDLQRRLEKFDYNVVGLCTTGTEAVEKTGEFLPDIILMDIMLAGDIDGIDAAKRIKDQYQIPVIFLTAYADEKTLERAKEAEPFGYILKPFKEKELYTTIDIALYKHKVDKTLKRQERRFSAILHSIADGIIATDNERKIQFLNPVAEEITGWKEAEAQTKSIENLISIIDENTNSIIQLPAVDTPITKKSIFYFKNAVVKNRNGDKIPVEGTIASIRDSEKKVEGQVIAIRDVTQLREMSDKISYQASHDALTGLYNREAFSQSLKGMINSANKENRQHALIYLDLDQFKLINDTIGHAAGDELLLETTGIMKSVFRSSDVCARLGGDEFGVLLSDTDQDMAYVIAQRLHNRLSERRLIWDKTAFNIHSSIGLVTIDTASEDIHSVLAAADDACYIAKDEGGRRIRVYKTSDSTFKKRRGEMQWVTRLTRALEEDRFELFYQNIIPISQAAKETRMEKFELLIRMVDEEGNIIPPADFLPAAERYNMMPSIDRWVINTAMGMYNKVASQNGTVGKRMIFTINLSAESMADEHFLEFIQNQIKSHGVKPSDFCFEITETVTISNMTTASKFIHELKALGCTFALDDFGSGFSSFNYLKNMPVDYLKIDGSFVKDMDENAVNSAMVEAINNLGHVMGIKTIAEFVRNRQILDRLKDLGIDYAQGYEISKPQSLKELIGDLD